MKRAILFSKLIDILYIILIIGASLLICTMVILPFVVNKLHLKIINNIDINPPYSTLFLTFIIVIVLFFYSIKALRHLRKVSKALLNNDYFSEAVIINLKKSGISFIILACIIIGYGIYNSIVKLYYNMTPFTLNENILLPSLLIIIGIFFIIQSGILLKAKNIEEENKLTI